MNRTEGVPATGTFVQTEPRADRGHPHVRRQTDFAWSSNYAVHYEPFNSR